MINVETELEKLFLFIFISANSKQSLFFPGNHLDSCWQALLKIEDGRRRGFCVILRQSVSVFQRLS